MTETRPAAVLHVASHRINVGDGALISAIQMGVRRAAGARGVEFRDFDIIDLEPEFGGVDFRSAVDTAAYDLILVGGGGTIDNKRTRSSSGMAFPLSGDEIRDSPVPIAFVAVGYNLFAGTRLRHADRLAAVLNACEERGFPFSVRNDGSLQRLQHAVGSAADFVTEIPDPGFFIAVDPLHVPAQFSGHRPRVIVQVAGDNPGFRFAGGLPDGAIAEFAGRVRNKVPLGTTRRLVSELAENVRGLVERLDAEVILAPHISKDLPLVSEILRRLPVGLERKRVRVLGVPDPAAADRFFAAYSAADLVIGMRGHSVICAVGLRVPCVALSSHPKVAGFMEACGLHDWVVPYAPGMAGTLMTMAESLLDDPADQLERRDNGTASFRTRFDDFLDRCWAMVNPPADPGV